MPVHAAFLQELEKWGRWAKSKGAEREALNMTLLMTL